MNPKEIENARTRLRNAGTPADRDRLRSIFIAKARKDVETLRHGKDAVRQDFRKKLERWETREVPADVPVCAIPSDVHDTRLYRITAAFALLCEMGLAAWVFGRLGVSWWLGAMTALFITVTLHGVFLQLFDDPERPKHALYRIKHVVLIPAIVGFLVALALGMLARYVYGSLALVLLPLFSLALWLGTLSLLLLAASLFTIAHLRGWSIRHEKAHRKLDAEEWTSAAFLEELGDEAPTLKPRSSIAETTSPASDNKGNSHGIGISAMIILALVLAGNAACAPVASSGEIRKEAMTEAAPPAALQVLIDWSGSCVRPALEEAWHTVKTELPTIIETHNIRELSISSFDEDGWSPKELLTLAMPLFDLPAHRKPNMTEWDSFANIRDAKPKKVSGSKKKWRRRITIEKISAERWLLSTT